MLKYKYELRNEAKRVIKENVNWKEIFKSYYLEETNVAENKKEKMCILKAKNGNSAEIHFDFEKENSLFLKKIIFKGEKSEKLIKNVLLFLIKNFPDKEKIFIFNENIEKKPINDRDFMSNLFTKKESERMKKEFLNKNALYEVEVILKGPFEMPCFIFHKEKVGKGLGIERNIKGILNKHKEKYPVLILENLQKTVEADFIAVLYGEKHDIKFFSNEKAKISTREKEYELNGDLVKEFEKTIDKIYNSKKIKNLLETPFVYLNMLLKAKSSFEYTNFGDENIQDLKNFFLQENINYDLVEKTALDIKEKKDNNDCYAKTIYKNVVIFEFLKYKIAILVSNRVGNTPDDDVYLNKVLISEKIENIIEKIELEIKKETEFMKKNIKF